MWDGIHEGENDIESIDTTTYKQLATRKNKDKKAYVLIGAIESKEMSHNIISIIYYYGDLKKLKDLYGSHVELELIQLLLSLFNLELKDNDPMALTS